MRLYKAVITDIPAAAKVKFSVAYPHFAGEDPEEFGFDVWTGTEDLVQDPQWRPEGWCEFIEDRAASGDRWAIDCRNDDYPFFWPKISDAYKSRSTARSKAMLAERWGAKVTIFEAEVSKFISSEDAKRIRKEARDQSRIKALEDKIQVIRNS